MNAPLPPAAMALPSIAIAEIYPSRSNPRKRIDAHYIAELAESIRGHGLIQPITVRPMPLDSLFEYNKRRDRNDDGLPPNYEIVVGECRWRAAKLAGLTEIPAYWRDLDDKQVLELQVIENLQRQDVHPIEEAEGFAALIRDHGYKADTLGGKIGKSRSHVYARLKLLALTPKAREVCYEEKLEHSLALLVARVSPSLQMRALEKVLTGYGGHPLSYRTAQLELRSNFTIHLSNANWRLDDEDLVCEAGRCTDCPKRAGNDPCMTDEGIDPDVCTDTICFENKRLARRAQMITNAEARGITVFTSAQIDDIAPGGIAANLDRSRYMSLDTKADGDEEGRTYREILGDEAPISAIAEFGTGKNSSVVELAETTTLAEALRKAGYKASENEEIKPRLDYAVKPAKAREDDEREAETQRRTMLHDAIIQRLQTTPIDMTIGLRVLAMNTLRYHADFEIDEDIWATHGITLPEAFEDDEAIAIAIAAIEGWTPQQCFAFVMDYVTTNERTAPWNFGDPEIDHRPHNLIAAATLVGLDPDANPLPNAGAEAASTPTEAAPAAGLSAPGSGGENTATESAEGKTDPAPAPPANEKAKPTAPYAHPDNPLLTWSGRGRKPLWIRLWFEDHPDQTMEDLSTKSHPAPALPANEKPATGNRDLFPDAPEFPQPNEHGVYPAAKAEKIIWTAGKRHTITITLLQIAEGWITATSAHYGDGYYGGPLSLSHGHPHSSRAIAIADAADELRDMHLRPDANYGYTAAQRKSLAAWLDGLVKTEAA